MCRHCRYNSMKKCILNDNRELGRSYIFSRRTPRWCKIREKYIKFVNFLKLFDKK